LLRSAHIEGGFKESPIRLNKDLGQLEQWNEDTIKARADRLSETAVNVWCAPHLAAEVLETYRPRVESTSGYSIEDHPYLLTGVGRELFEAFRKEVLSLDLVVREEFLKQYVAYKA
jgi:hypothetical protein